MWVFFSSSVKLIYIFDDSFTIDDVNTNNPLDSKVNSNAEGSNSILPEVHSQYLAEQIYKNGEDFRALFNLDDIIVSNDSNDDSLANKDVIAKNDDTTEKPTADNEMEFQGFSDNEMNTINRGGGKRRDYIFLAMENILNESKVSNSILGIYFICIIFY